MHVYLKCSKAFRDAVARAFERKLSQLFQRLLAGALTWFACLGWWDYMVPTHRKKTWPL